MQPIPLFDLSRQGPVIDDVIKKAVERVLTHQQFILGPEVTALEQALKSFLGNSADVIAVSSGTDGLLTLLMAYEIGVGDAVITTPYTFFATAGCVHRVGAEIVFCDIDPATYMMDPEKLKTLFASFLRDTDGTLRTASGNKVKMIIPIHLFGTCCAMDAINALAKEYGLLVIEDAAQVIGTDFPSHGKSIKAGTIADASYFSFYPSKNLGAAGDAGLAVCRDAGIAERIRCLRNHGMEERYYHKMVGGNFRMDALQAAILHAKLPFINEWNAKRRANAAVYKAAFTAAGLLDRITLPEEPFAASALRDHHIYHQYVIRVIGSSASGAREKIISHLKNKKIGHAIYYPVPLHLQECFAYLGYKKGDFPESEYAAEETLALPIFPELRQDEIASVVKAIAETV
ncbi:MAG: DegT/DnrJ/EryC1/StrS family aminotransferase [Chthoniobacterales bacterium]